jgi:hypothetical protein
MHGKELRGKVIGLVGLSKEKPISLVRVQQKKDNYSIGKHI